MLPVLFAAKKIPILKIHLHSVVYNSDLFQDRVHPAIMEDVITSAKRLASNADEAGRKKVIDGLRDLFYSVETPDDTIQKLTYMVDLRIAEMKNFGRTDIFSTYKPQRSALV